MKIDLIGQLYFPGKKLDVKWKTIIRPTRFSGSLVVRKRWGIFFGGVSYINLNSYTLIASYYLQTETQFVYDLRYKGWK